MTIHYEYSITNEEGKYYKSNREHVSIDCRWVDDELDATFMNESDLLYLVYEAGLLLSGFSNIHLSYKQIYIGSIMVSDFIYYPSVSDKYLYEGGHLS